MIQIYTLWDNCNDKSSTEKNGRSSYHDLTMAKVTATSLSVNHNISLQHREIDKAFVE